MLPFCAVNMKSGDHQSIESISHNNYNGTNLLSGISPSSDLQGITSNLRYNMQPCSQAHVWGLPQELCNEARTIVTIATETRRTHLHG